MKQSLVLILTAAVLMSCGPKPRPSPFGDKADVGEPCDEARDCITYVCSRGECALPPQPDEGSKLTACNSSGDCESPLSCILGVCRPLGAENSPCATYNDCEVPLVCAQGKCMTQGVAGSPCASYFECSYPLTCTNGACAACTITNDSAQLGAPCCYDAHCANPDQYCILGTCRPLGGTGCQCGVDDDCIFGNCQSGKCAGGGTCWENAPTPGPGPVPTDDACETDSDCPTGNVCMYGLCKYSGTPSGVACDHHLDCGSFEGCENGYCKPCADQTGGHGSGYSCCSDDNCIDGLYCILGTCKNLGYDGDACQVDDDCGSLFCDGGVCAGDDEYYDYLNYGPW